MSQELLYTNIMHKYYKNEKLTKLIRFRVRNGKEDLQLKEVVMEKNNTLLDLKEKHLNGRYSNQHNKGRVVFYEEEEDGKYTGSFTGETLIDRLDEEKIYVVEV